MAPLNADQIRAAHLFTVYLAGELGQHPASVRDDVLRSAGTSDDSVVLAGLVDLPDPDRLTSAIQGLAVGAPDTPDSTGGQKIDIVIKIAVAEIVRRADAFGAGFSGYLAALLPAGNGTLDALIRVASNRALDPNAKFLQAIKILEPNCRLQAFSSTSGYSTQTQISSSLVTATTTRTMPPDSIDPRKWSTNLGWIWKNSFFIAGGPAATTDRDQDPAPVSGGGPNGGLPSGNFFEDVDWAMLPDRSVRWRNLLQVSYLKTNKNGKTGATVNYHQYECLNGVLFGQDFQGGIDVDHGQIMVVPNGDGKTQFSAGKTFRLTLPASTRALLNFLISIALPMWIEAMVVFGGC